MSNLIERARQLRTTIEALSAHLTDEEALDAPDLFPHWNPDSDYEAGKRVFYNGKLYKVLPPGHSANPTYNPVDAPSLFAEILPGQDGTAIGEWVQPDSTNPYQVGNRVIHNGIIYECVAPNNVWEPGVYGWEIVTE